MPKIIALRDSKSLFFIFLRINSLTVSMSYGSFILRRPSDLMKVECSLFDNVCTVKCWFSRFMSMALVSSVKGYRSLCLEKSHTKFIRLYWSTGSF